jgi:hypothetical protein
MKKTKMGKRIFIGLSNTAGYGTRLVKGFRSIGIKADLYISGEHPFNYDTSYSHRIKSFSNIWLKRLYVRLFFLKSLFKYDAFIFFSGESLLKNYRDFNYYRKFNKKTMMIFLGCDVQQPELTFRKDIPFSACHNCEQEYKNFVGCVPEKKLLRTRRIEEVADYIVSHTAISDALEREYVNVIQPINIEDFPEYTAKKNNKTPVILHAPSNFGYKGTKYLVEAVKKLKKEFKFDFKLVNNVTIKELYEEIQKADIIVDQLIQGWYGMLPLEAMMFSKPVICYLRDDVVKALPDDCPIINANPGNIYEVLKHCLQNQNMWRDTGLKGRNYVIQNHDSRKIAKQYADLLLQ